MDDLDIAAVDDLMSKYDTQEKDQKQNEEFVNLLQKDEKLRRFFEDNYQPGADATDDEKFVSFEFSKFSEEGWSDNGKPLGKKVLGKKKAKLFAEDIVKKWKGFDVLETEPKRLQAKLDLFLMGKFEPAWKKFDQTKNGSGMIDMMEAHEFMKEILPRADSKAVSIAQEEDIMNAIDKSGVL